MGKNAYVGVLTSTILLAAGAAVAAPVEHFKPVTQDLFGNPTGNNFNPRSAVGDVYFFAPGIGSTEGLSLTGTYEDSIFDLQPQVIGTDIEGATITSSQSQVLVQGTTNQYDVSLSLTSSSGELFPSGWAIGGAPANTAGLFLGENANGNPLDFSAPVEVNSAFINLYDTEGESLGSFDITSFASFTAGPGGTWPGSMGVTFGAGSTGVGIATASLDLNVTVIPEPGTATLLGLGAAGLLIRRRRA